MGVNLNPTHPTSTNVLPPLVGTSTPISITQHRSTKIVSTFCSNIKFSPSSYYSWSTSKTLKDPAGCFSFQLHHSWLLPLEVVARHISTAFDPFSMFAVFRSTLWSLRIINSLIAIGVFILGLQNVLFQDSFAIWILDMRIRWTWGGDTFSLDHRVDEKHDIMAGSESSI